MNAFIITGDGFLASIYFNRDTHTHNFTYSPNVRGALKLKTSAAKEIIEKNNLHGFIWKPYQETPGVKLWVAVKVNEYDTRGYNSIVSVFNDLIVASRISDISVQFQYNLSTEDVIIIAQNGANASQGNSEMILQSGTNLNGDVSATSVKSLRYKPGHEAFAIFTSAWVTGGVNGVKQYAGILNEDEDGYKLCIIISHIVSIFIFI